MKSSSDSRTLNSDYPTGRIVRDAQLYKVGAGTQEIRRMLIGREFSKSSSLPSR